MLFRTPSVGPFFLHLVAFSFYLKLLSPPVETVVTFFPRKEPEAGKDDGGRHKDGDLLSSIYNDLKGDLATECNDAWDLSAVIVRHAVTILLERIAGENLKVFRLFEEYISFLVRLLPLKLA